MDDVDGEPSQAERMMRRVSPAGRAQARREANTRARARRPAIVAAVGALLVLIGMAVVGAPSLALLIMAIAAAAVVALVAIRARPARVTDEMLVHGTPLPELPARASVWLADQRPALPAPAVPLTDALERRLDELRPQLASLSPAEPAAEAVRKLLVTELPALVQGYRAVPASLRDRTGADGRSADTQLLDGLRLIDAEVARMTEGLARGALDEVATQGRYLQLKYRGEDDLTG